MYLNQRCMFKCNHVIHIFHLHIAHFPMYISLDCHCGKKHNEFICGSAQSKNINFSCDQICDKFVFIFKYQYVYNIYIYIYIYLY